MWRPCWATRSTFRTKALISPAALCVAGSSWESLEIAFTECHAPFPRVVCIQGLVDASMYVSHSHLPNFHQILMVLPASELPVGSLMPLLWLPHVHLHPLPNSACCFSPAETPHRLAVQLWKLLPVMNWNRWQTGKKKYLGNVIYQAFEIYGKISNYKKNGIGWLLLEALGDLEKKVIEGTK